MFLTIYTPGMPFNGSTIDSGKSLGGSESAAYYMARELVKLGHRVVVFTAEKQCGTWDGVQYEWIGDVNQQYPLGHRYMFAIQSPTDVIISQRHPHSFAFPANSKINIWWLHDLAMARNIPHIQKSLLKTDKIFTVSEFHKNQVSEIYGINKQHIYATRNGMDYSSLKGIDIPGFYERRGAVLFASRPERGLENIVKPDGLAEMLPGIQFEVCGYDNIVPEMVQFYKYLYSRCEALPNVTNLGHLSKRELWAKMRSVKAVVYPTTFEDTSNMLAIEGAANGCPFIAPEIAALPETCKGGFAKLIPLKDGEVDVEQFADQVQLTFDHEDAWNYLHQNALRNYQPWDAIAQEWSDLFEQMFLVRTYDETRSIKHFIENSDIMFIKDQYPKEEILMADKDFERNYSFVGSGEEGYKDHYQRYYEYEKNRGVVYGPEEQIGQPRFMAVADMVKSKFPRDVLDLGCAHGHYTINLAKLMPETNFLGVDLAASNIVTAKKWAEDDKVENATFLEGTAFTLGNSKFDCIIMAEVLEHIENYMEVVQHLYSNHLANGGKMVISVPYGPWEALGYMEHQGWRAHIHHFERADLQNLFGEMKDYRVLSLPHGNNIGHFVLEFYKDKSSHFGEIDKVRKRKIQSPRETVSLCMIVKDAEDTIAGCLKNIGPYVDEIIVGVDKTTTDKTVERMKEAVLKYGMPDLHWFEIDSPMKIGFDAARDLTVDMSLCDWVLWMDDDEKFEYPERIHEYLRKNTFAGYMIPQHHFGTEPAEILQTDWPVRLFRDTGNIKFFGVVHEHPSIETDLNAGVGEVYKIENLSIAHLGYSTEAKRRTKFHRNYPLMKRDREKYPDRVLGKFLYTRDLAHELRYILGTKGGNQRCIDIANEAIELWEDQIDDPLSNIRYIMQGLPYYHECVQFTHDGRSVPFEGGVGDLTFKAMFHNTKIIKKLMSRLTKESLNPFEVKYF